ncbi:MAG: iron-sulfur cluster assembly protein [Candidatus Marinimicrobia bacterium]|mgnify:FL=1|jgi:metal-sulfur cluster biosynthetic enzyme|nr:iron-sulfur cluster assembly protein [Candidatus Neomarinimicrobiota bacterium]MDP7026057.1 iron-sulfur cluster assembly protein [Candidatus Neomarinimicrobiota bacterium]|tara:strand:- start:16 stop:369 length:354 start_codon:yes stop_codon:yes gene_type:complete
MSVTEPQVIEVLKQCYDPEIPVDLWSLGLIYDIKIQDQDNNCYIDIIMSLTTPGCAMGNYMAQDIKTKLEAVSEITEANVRVTFDPPWNPEMMSDEAKGKLGFSPPAATDQKSNSVD